MSTVMPWPSGSARAAIAQASARAQASAPGFLRPTPLLKLPGQALGLPCAEVWLKWEQLQVSGSFKARGMLNRLLSQTVPPSGVCIASGGNAGIAAASAAQALGHVCEVFLPEVASMAKRERLRQLGAQVVVGGAAYADALAACTLRQGQSGALMLHAYDQTEVVLGAGSLAREIEEQGGTPDSVLVSVGGGGLIAGIAAWFESTARVVALEPHLAPTLHAARAAGEPLDVAVSGLAADSLGAKRIGSIAWEVTQKWVDDSLLLTDTAIKEAQLWLWREMRVAVEPAAALPLAALQTGAYVPAASERVCLVVCGGNVDPATLA